MNLEYDDECFSTEDMVTFAWGKEGHTVTSRTSVTGTRMLLNDGIGLTLDPAF